MYDLISPVPHALFETIGVLGFCLYVLNYMLLTFHRLTSHSTTYFTINLAAAAMVLIGLTHSFNLASALIQLFWIVISVAAIIIRMRAAKTGQGVQRLTPRGTQSRV